MSHLIIEMKKKTILFVIPAHRGMITWLTKCTTCMLKLMAFYMGYKKISLHERIQKRNLAENIHNK